MRRSLRWIEEAHLEGLAYIRLEDSLPELDNRADKWAKRAVAEGRRVYGWYASRERSEQPHIVLYVHEIYRGLPKILWWSNLPTLRIVRSLAHEVAHHLAATQGQVLSSDQSQKDQEEESAADKYAANVLDRMKQSWLNRLGGRGLKEIAQWHYVFGIADLRAKKYGEAADSFYKAWDLDPSNKEAGDLYWRAREMSDAKPR
jgi:Zn-dependent peptidase ImmA (M78 family)